MSDGIEVCPVQLPGRENRITEPPLTDMSHLLDLLAAHLNDVSDIPFAFFGHSMGGVIAFELAHHLRGKNMAEPAHLFISGTPLPHILEAHSRSGMRCCDLPDDQFIDIVIGSARGIPDKILKSKEMMHVILPTLRADLAIMESLPQRGGCGALSIPMTAFGGEEDEMVVPADVAGWESYTTSSFTKVMLPGGHYFIHTEHNALLRHVNETALLYLL